MSKNEVNPGVEFGVEAMVQAPSGISTWSGTDRDGTPVYVDSCERNGPMWIKGQQATKVTEGARENTRRRDLGR